MDRPGTTDSAPQAASMVEQIDFWRVAEAMPAIVFVGDPAGQILYANLQASQFTGRKPDQLTGAGWFQAIHPEDRPHALAGWKSAVAVGEPYQSEFRLVAAAEGPGTWFLCRATPVRADGQVVQWVGVCTEIEDRKCTEDLLAKSEAWYRSTFDHKAVGVAHLSLDGKTLEANDHLRELIGIEQSASGDRHHGSSTPLVSLQLDLDELAPIVSGELDRYSTFKSYIRENGTAVSAHLTVALCRHDNGEPSHFVVFCKDVTAYRAEYDRLQRTLKASGVVGWEWDPETDRVDHTGDEHALLGRRISGGAEFFEAINRCDRSKVQAAAARALAGAPYDIRFRVDQPGGSERWVRDQGHLITLDGRAVLCGILQDVTEQKRAEDAIFESEERLRLAFAASRTSAWDWSVATGEIIWADSLTEYAGLSETGFGGRFEDFWELVHEEDKPLLSESLRAALAGEADYAVEFRMVRPDGSVRWTATRAIVLRDDAGSPVRMVGVDTDITDRKQAEEDLQRSNALLLLLLDTFKDRVQVVELDGRLTYSNKVASEALRAADQPPSAPVTWLDQWPDDARPSLEQAWKSAVEGTCSTVELGWRRDAAGTRWWRVALQPVSDLDRGTRRILVLSSDISESRRLDEEVATFRERIDLANRAARSLTYDYDSRTDRAIYSETLSDILGYDLSEFPETLSGWVELIHPQDRTMFLTSAEHFFQAGGRFELGYRLQHKLGHFIWVSDIADISVGKAGRVRVVGTVTDVTEKHQISQALSESEGRLRAALDAIPQMVWTSRPDGYHDFFNARWYEFTGIVPGSSDGMAYLELFHPDDRSRLVERWANALGTGEPYQIEYRLRDRSNAYRWVLGRALPEKDENGTITRWLGTCTEIEEIVNTRHALSAELENKVTLLNEVNHRVKNSLQIASSLLNLQASKIENEDAKFALFETDRRLSILARVHENLYKSEKHTSLEVCAHLEGLADDLVSSLSDGSVEFSFSCDGELWLALDQAIPLSLVIAELIINSVKYAFVGREAGSISLEITGSGKDLILCVSDDGCGLPADFDPASSKGLGMRVVHALLRQLGARLEVEETDRGACFVIRAVGLVERRASSSG